MIKVENIDTYGWEAAVRGMRNPMNSWDKSDSYENYTTSFEDGFEVRSPYYRVGAADVALMKSLVKAGTDHRKFLRMINVTMDITAPLYWWKEFDTYKVGTVRNSCSTMHKIHSKEITLDDFSFEDFEVDYGELFLSDCFTEVVTDCEMLRKRFVESGDKKYWRGLTQLLPSSYNQKATLMLNYEVLANIYHSRKAHKLDEWVEFCKWIETLPYSELITGANNNNENILKGANNG